VPSVFEDLTVAENLGVARFGTPATALPDLDEVLGDVHLSSHATALAGSLSHGARSGWRSACCSRRRRA